MLCIVAGDTLLALAAAAFTLSWTHSVERTEWWESWQIADGKLQVIEARVEGAGAGIAVPAGARMTPQGWVFRPETAPLTRLVLAASGTTPSGWTLCTDAGCHELGATAGRPIEIWSSVNCAVTERD